MNARNHQTRRSFGAPGLWLALFGAIAAGLPAALQLIYLGSTNRYGVLAAFGWGFFFILGPCLVFGAFVLWWERREASPEV
ncbi:hypothetical protein ACFSWE_03470 [Leucobacter albus]|uniref:Uncharacterized protein n=1 Tax=Leucobacter albus TaxID=272210 RepID=A0ABW3TRR3_9MICO